ncbi:intraflagellar transport protein 80 homolog [Clavelina lepadiformis]|uniref:Intraflagellar transport protein 80 homolog n=1 Tax=Clavelina lepadiformis TaxID=159417 RepID=A0ABP0F5U9_CLALP
MRLKLNVPKAKGHSDVATCVIWSSADSVLSCGDDHTILKWDLLTGESSLACKLGSDVYPTHVSQVPGQSKGGRNSSNLFAVTSSDGKFHFFSDGGRVEKSVEAHTGAVLCGKWSYDGSAYITAGEDGQIKIWSRSGMLRSTLSQLSCCIYSVAWSPESDQVLYTYGKELVIKPLQPSGKLVKWKAHDGIVLNTDWNPVNNLILSGGEDCKYKIWDSYGRLLFSSTAQDYPITSIAWSPSGELFAVGSFNSIRLCDKAGWCHSLEKSSTGSMANIAWSNDSTQVATACSDGNVMFAHCVEKHLEWCEYEVTLVSRKSVEVHNVVNDAHEALELKDRVIKLSLAFNYLIVITSSQCHIYSTDNFNTPSIFELRQGNVSFIMQAEKHFLLADSSGIHVYSYDGRHLCNPKIPSSSNTLVLNSRTLALSPDVLAVKDNKDDCAVLLFDALSGKPLGDGRPVVHKLEIIEVHLSQCGSLSDRFLTLVDKNHDVYLASVQKQGGNYSLAKLTSMVQSLSWNTTVNMLCGLSDSNLTIWFYPPALFVDQSILPSTQFQREYPELGKYAEISFYHENTVSVYREDGSLISLAVTPYPAVLHRLVSAGKWHEAVRLCRFAKDGALWGSLAAMSLKDRDLNTAEIAYAAIEEADKVECINEIKNIGSKEVKGAEMALFCGNSLEPEASLLHSGMIYRAIQLNIDLFRWERALDLAVKHKTHVDTVLWFRQIHLQRLHRSETNSKFKKYSQGVNLNWENIQAKIDHDLAA